MLEPPPFRFLDLPKELRFMVYERLPVSTKHIRLIPLEDGFQIESPARSFHDQSAITITLHTLPVQILSTCQLLYSESLRHLTRKLDKIRKTMPSIIVDADCLYANFPDSTLQLLYAVIDSLETHPFFSTHLGSVCSPTARQAAHQNFPKEVHQWLAQCTHLFLSQRPTPGPFSGFMGTYTYPTVRLIIEVPKLWQYTTPRGQTDVWHTFMGTPPIYTASVTSQLSQIYSELVDYTKKLRHVKSGAIVFGQEDERKMTKDGLVVKKTVALEFGITKMTR